MDLIFCTLFDSNYLDKGLVLYDSMEKCMENFKLYVFAFDQKCEELLKAEKKEHLCVISLTEFESPELLQVKKTRTKSEYCWTCTPWTIKYVLEKYDEKICTYIDADMRFFSSPQSIFDDMRNNNKSVLIVPHRAKNQRLEKKLHDTVGTYCVEFNTFINNSDGKEALDWWATKCLEWCCYALPGTTEWYGDQKYLNVFPEKFKGVQICNHLGVGLAPWNTKLIKESEKKDLIPQIKSIATGETFPLVIYHFESVSFLTSHIINAPSGIRNKQLREDIYGLYIKEISLKRKYILDKYNFELQRKRRVVTNNFFMKIYQKYLLPIRRIKSLHDLYRIEE